MQLDVTSFEGIKDDNKKIIIQLLKQVNESMKKLVSLVLAGAMAFSVASCGNLTPNSSTTTPAASSAPAASQPATEAKTDNANANFNVDNISEHTFKLSTTASPGSSLSKTAQYFSERVSELSNGKMKVDVYEASALGSEEQNLEALTSGTLDMAIIAVEFYVNSIPQLGALILPYTYTEYDQVQKVLESEAGEYANKQMLDVAGVKNLGYYTMAFRNMYTVKEIKNVDDLAGVKMRVPGSALYVETFKMLGAAPTPLAMSEVYTAIDTGVVEGLENTPDTCLNNSFYEVAKYFNRTKHLNAPTTFSMSNKVFESLNEDEQKLLIQAGLDTSHFGLDLTKQLDADYQKQLADKGMIFVDSDIPSMKAKIDVNKYAFMASDEAKKLYELVQKNLK